MILKNISIFYGSDLKFIKKTNVQISGDKFKKISPRASSKNAIDCDGLLLIPGLINSHTHIGDSVAKDLGLNKDVDSKINPIFGMKQKILRETPPKKLIQFMRKTAQSMIKKGITCFVDFREGGLDGVFMAKNALDGIPIRSVILGRIEKYQSKEQIKRNSSMSDHYKKELKFLLEYSDGLGISGSNENSDSFLKEFSKTKKIRAIHCAETKQSASKSKLMTKKTEVQRGLLLKPHFLIHMTYSTRSDLKSAAKKTNGIVVCPRANASLAEGIPDVMEMLKMKCNIAIGTDNVMINSPNLFREMDFLWKVTMGINQKRIDPKKIVKMTTVNAGKLLGKKIGCIKEGYLADAVFIKKKDVDLDPLGDPYAAIVHRVSEKSIGAVMIGGRIVHGKI